VLGNHDHSIGYDVDPRCTARYQKMADVTRRYSASVLKKDQKEFLRQLPLKLELKRQDTKFYLCHAKPSDPLYGWLLQGEIQGWLEKHLDVALPSINEEIERREAVPASIQTKDHVLRLLLAVKRKEQNGADRQRKP
jgi:hypothetical protein